MTDEQQQQGEDLQGTDLSAFCGPAPSEAEGREEVEVEVSDAAEDVELERQAKCIFESGQALEFIETVCHEKHVGDAELIRALLLSFAGTHVLHCELEININLTGEAGSGKSHAVNTVIDILPQSRVLEGRFSEHELLYKAAEMQAGSVISFDDEALSETQAEIMKGTTSNPLKPYVYHTLNEKREPIDIPFPPRCVRWYTKADDAGYVDEQVRDRQLHFIADNRDEHQQQAREQNDKFDEFPHLTKDKTGEKICLKIWKHLPDAVVAIPFVRYITCTGKRERNRTYEIFKQLIRAAAVIRSPVRKRTREGSIIATPEDFKTAAQIMNAVFSEAGSQRYGWTTTQRDIISYLKKQLSGPYEFTALQNTLHIPAQSFRDAVLGRGTRGGLERAPGIEVTVNEYRRRVIVWNKEEYESSADSKEYYTLDDWGEEEQAEWEGKYAQQAEVTHGTQ